MRYEVKFAGAELDYARVRAELRMLSAGLRPIYSPRVVQSIYFDTADGRALEENLAGISRRQKLRLRWYGESSKNVTAQLERKIRDSGLGDKEVHALPEAIDIDGASRMRFTGVIKQMLPETAATQLDGHEPVQWIRYRREYLGSLDGRLRITIDRDLRSADQRVTTRLSIRRPTPLPRLLVVEIKASETQRDAIQSIVQEMQLPPSKCSKFVVACAPGEGPMISGYW